MKIKALSAVALLAAGSVVGLSPHAANAGCGVTIEMHNLDPVGASVDWSQSKVTQNGIAWNTLGNTTQGVAANGTISQTFSLFAGCSAQRRYKFKVTEGGSTQTVYFPSPTTYTTDITPHVHIDF